MQHAMQIKSARLRSLRIGIPIDAIAVAHRPGLIGSLLIGVTAAKTLAWALGKPLIGVDHVHAHLYSVVLEQERTAAHARRRAGRQRRAHGAVPRELLADVTLIGSTIDDAVGEAYDKVAAILGLGYPGGPIIDRLAARGRSRRRSTSRARCSAASRSTSRSAA